MLSSIIQSHSRFARFLIPVLFLFISFDIHAQDKPLFDSSYYRTYPELITGRIFLSQKYLGLRVERSASSQKFLYRSNAPLAAGIGATYRAVTLNIALGALKDKERGKTTSLDLLSHVYTRKWIGDITAQFYKGYHIPNQGYVTEDPNGYYSRRDIKITTLGLAAFRVLNDQRFSYRAAFLQNEWQKKSAGTFLVGGEAYHGLIRGDSALVPAALNALYTQKGIDKISFFEIGPGVGYAYTLVLKQHFFLTGSANVNADLNYTKEYTGNTSEDKFAFSPNLGLRGALGYNGDKWSINASWIASTVRVNATASRDDYFVRAGNYRLTFVKRFMPGKGLKKVLKIVDWIPYM